MKKNVLNNFIEKIKDFPLWIKQVIFIYLYNDLKSVITEDFINKNEKELVYLYVPELSYIGQTELEERKRNLELSAYTFLEGVDEGLSLIEIALNNFWTLSEVCKYFIATMELNLIKTPVPINIAVSAGLLSGKYKTGEYFKRMGVINVDQLELAIRKQKELIAEGKQIRIASVLIELGFITKEDVGSVLKIKEEANKRFILDSSIIPEGYTDKNNKYVQEIENLKKQNNILKAKLKKLLSFFKKS